MLIHAELAGDPSAFDLHADIENGMFVFDNEAYRLGRLDLTAHVNPDTTSAQVRNELIYLDLRSNADPTTFSTAIVEHFSSYFDSNSLRRDTIPSTVKFVLDARIAPAPILTEVFVDKLVDLDTILITVDFNEQADNLDASISAPHIDYDGYVIDSLFLKLNSLPSTFNFDLGFAEIEAGQINMKTTSLLGRGSDGELDLTLVSYDEGEPLIHVDSELRGSKEVLRYHIVPEGLLFNKEEWNIPENNEAILTEDKLTFNAFKISRNTQSIELTDEVGGIEKDHIALLFENFELGDFLSYLNPDEELASGRLQGDLILEEPFGNKVLLANLDIEELLLLDVDMGKLSMNASSTSLDRYDFAISMKEGAIDLDLKGDLLARSSEPDINLTLDLNRVDMQVIESFSSDEITETSGSLNGYVNIQGPLFEPEYQGKLNFDQSAFNLKRFNASFNLPSEELVIDNQGLTLADFKVLDVNGNSFTLSGKVLTDNPRNPKFDLTVKASSFQILNATEEDNEFLYGIATFNLDGTIQGDLELPIIDVKLGVDENTDITYVFPTAAATYESMDEVVIFVNRDKPDAILTKTNEVTVSLGGFDIKAKIAIGNKAKAKVIIDKETGDNFQIAGAGDLIFMMDPNGRMSLTGVYDVSSGSYEMNLYNIVNRRFELSPGSKVSWSGDPFDAKLDIRAIYQQEASTAPLMANVTSGLDPAAKLKYRQVLPFYVYLDVKGNLDAPELSFALDMPEDKQGAIGGQVYGRIQQVNQQEEELNKQVFSLLVLNRFYPESGSDGSSGGVASVARDNLNDALSDQLNIFSDKLMGQTGVQLDFGLDSYTDYQGEAPTERTQLDVAAKKSLFNDRLIVSVGSEFDIQGGTPTEEATPLIGKVSIEYVLTQDGQYRLKGFRRNEFENVIDGQTIVSGIALIFAQEFNEFNELWKAIFRKNGIEE